MIKLGKYKHYKGNMYEDLMIAKNSEDLTDMVIYKALYGNNQIWARPISMWEEEVIINGKPIKRFTFVE